MDNKEINLDFEIIGLNDEVIGHAGINIANFLATELKGNAIKFLDWAMAFNKKKSVSMDEADLTLLKETLNATDRIPVLIKGQVLKKLNTLK